MSSRPVPPPNIDLSRLRHSYFSLIASPEVNRLLEDITTCTLKPEDKAPDGWDNEPPKGGVELFPYLAVQTRRHQLTISGALFPNQEDQVTGMLYHIIRLRLGEETHYFRLSTSQASYLLSPFHCRFVSSIFGLSWFYALAISAGTVAEDFLAFAPYSLEEQVIARYLQSLIWIPCATVKLDAQDTPYIGSRLYTPADMKRCQIPGSRAEESIIRGWRLFKRLLYHSIEGERIFTGFAFLPPHKSLEEQRQRWSNLLLYHKSDQVQLNEGIEAIKQLLLNADGRTTFLTVHKDRIVGVLHLTEGAQRQLTTSRSWRDSLYLATISWRGRFNFWLALKGRRRARIPLSLLEYRHGRIQIPLFQDVFWQEVERQLRSICPDCCYPEVLQQFRQLLRGLRAQGRGGILLVGLSASKLQEPYVPIENEVRLAQPTPLQPQWGAILLGLAKSDGALIFNERLEATHFRARLKATGLQLPPLAADELGSGTRHQATREFSAYYPDVLGVCISTDGPVSLYRTGRLISRLY
ncbi:MAG: hypothetical protein FJ135_12095 [Deltaproteobacteria bacterium]|nr:hypothetical protein [Deltaproteobacteria bacterium]